MTLSEFYSTLLPTSGRYVLFNLATKQHSYFSNLVQLTQASAQRTGSGTYFAAASFGEEDNRTQANVQCLRTYRIDIDAGAAKQAKDPTGTYPTQHAAKDALVAAIKAGLPMPTLIVSSGEGLHVYWALGTDIAPAAWRPVAANLGAACAALGLRVDPTVTTDTCRLLRPIGTLHPNGSTVTLLRDTRTIYSPEQIAQSLERFAPQDALFARPANGPRKSSINDDVLGGVRSAPCSLAKVAEHCAVVGHFRDSQGVVPEPLWRGVLGIAKYCEVDGEGLAHTWSAGHADYTPADTQAKLDRWDTPPTSCSYFSGAPQCATCPHAGKITTPKQLGQINVPVTEVEVEVEPAPPPVLSGVRIATTEPTPERPVPDRPDLFAEDNPFFYKRVGDHWTLFHTFKVQITDPAGAKVFNEVTRPVVHKLVWVDASSDVGASDTGGVLVQFGRVAHAESAQQDRFDMPAGTVAEVGTLTKFMLDQGINFATSNQEAGKHFRTYVQREMLRKQNDMRFVIKNRFGYHQHDGQFVSCLGAYTVYPDGNIVKTVHDRKLASIADSLTPSCLPPRATPQWGGDDWNGIRAAASDYSGFIKRHYSGEGYEKARLALAISLASPLMPFASDLPFSNAVALPPSGFVVSLFSTSSGVGKTALEDVVCAAYGRASLRKSGDSDMMTNVAGFTIAQNLAVFPMILDEVTRNNAAAACRIINAFANGIGRERSDQTGALQSAPKTWSLVTCMSTNVPQRELLVLGQKNSDALQMRMLELDFSDLPLTGNKDQFREEFHGIASQCGAFGLWQARAITYAGVDRMTKLVKRNLTRAFDLLGVDQTYRYFARALAVTLSNIQLLGALSPFTEDDIVASFRAALHTTRQFLDANKRSVSDQVEALLSAASPHVAVSEAFTKRHPRAETKHDVLLNPNVQRPLVGRAVHAHGKVYISRAFVRAWCADNQLPVATFLASAMKDGRLCPWGDGTAVQRVSLGMGLVGFTSERLHSYAFVSSPATSADVREEVAS